LLKKSEAGALLAAAAKTVFIETAKTTIENEIIVFNLMWIGLIE
jgi:hypothetical protein